MTEKMIEKRYIIATSIMIGILIASTIGISLTPKTSLLLTNYDPEEDAYWGMIKDDVLIYGIYDKLEFENGFNEKSYALLKHIIL